MLAKTDIAGTYQLHSEALSFRAALHGLLEYTNRQPLSVSYSFEFGTTGFCFTHRLGGPELFHLALQTLTTPFVHKGRCTITFCAASDESVHSP